MRADFRLGEWIIRPQRRRIERNGDSVQVTPKAMAVFECLVAADGEAVSRNDLFATVWPGAEITDDTLTGCVAELRKALGETARTARVIETIPKLGFRLIPAVETLEEREEAAAGHRQHSWPRRLIIGLVASIAVVVTAGLLIYIDIKPRKLSIAVLPFENISASEDLGFYAEGLTEEILDRLAQEDFCMVWHCSPVSVSSRTDAAQAANAGDSIAEFARDQNVNYVLEGSVREIAGETRITAQLIRARDGFHVWSRTYASGVTAGFDVQTAIARGIAHASIYMMGFDSLGQAKERLSRYPGTGALIPSKHLLAYFEEDGLQRIGEGGDKAVLLGHIRKAVAADPDSALVQALVANTYLRRMDSTLSLDDAIKGMYTALNRSNELDPGNLFALQQQAQLHHMLELNFAEAEKEFKELSEQEPSHLWPWLARAWIAAAEGRVADARQLLGVGATLHGGFEENILRPWEVLVWHTLGEYQRALVVNKGLLELVNDGPARADALRWRARLLLSQGNVREARGPLAEAWHIDGSIRPAAYIELYAASGEQARARRLLAGLDLESTEPATLVLAYLALGELDLTFEALRVAILEHNIVITSSLRLSPWWDTVREDPRFEEILALLDSEVTYTQRP